MNQEQGGEIKEERAFEEKREALRPRIYVASLSDYNNGRLHGVWLEAATSAEELHAQVGEMLRGSGEPGAEEWAIHDFEGFGGFALHEYESLETVASIARGIAEHGEAFAAFVSVAGTEAAGDSRAFEDAYLGRYESLRAYAEQLGDDLGWEAELDRAALSFRAYVSIDYDALGRDLGTELGEVPAAAGGLHLFDLRQ